MYHQLETTTSCDDMANTINSITNHQLSHHRPDQTPSSKLRLLVPRAPESLHSLTSCTAPVAVLNTILGLYPTATGTISCGSGRLHLVS